MFILSLDRRRAGVFGFMPRPICSSGKSIRREMSRRLGGTRVRSGCLSLSPIISEVVVQTHKEVPLNLQAQTVRQCMLQRACIT